MNPFSINNQPTYDPFAVQPMRDELLATGFNELLTPQDVDNAILENKGKTVFVVMNSVCGCAAGSARPGATLALQNAKIPDSIYTVFAGQEKEAMAHLRQTYLADYPPSSPAMILFRDGKVIFIMHRLDIEGYSADQIAATLVKAFNEHCSAEGPAISPEDYNKILHAKACGSKIPRFQS